MRTLARLGIPAGVITVLAASTVTLGVGSAGAFGPVPIAPILRNCDFSRVMTGIQVPRTSQGHGTAEISTSGSSATAHVHMVVLDYPGHHYDVGLIQAPMPSSVYCGPGAPGTTFAGLDTDESGQGDVTIQAPLRQGTTGVWVIVTSPNPHNNAPGEFYTSTLLTPI